MSDHIRLSGFDIRAAFPDDKLVDAASFDALQSETTALRADLARVTAELAECRNSRQREHDLRVKIAGDLEGTQEAFRRSDDKRAAAEAERDALKADDEAWRKSSLVQILADRDRAMELLRRARHWMNEAVGRNWQTHDAVDPGLFDSIDAALSLNDKENGT